jgi:hypothetical protein
MAEVMKVEILVALQLLPAGLAFLPFLPKEPGGPPGRIPEPVEVREVENRRSI